MLRATDLVLVSPQQGVHHAGGRPLDRTRSRAEDHLHPLLSGAILHAAPGGTHPDEKGVVRAYTGSCDPTPVQGRSHSVLRARGAIWPGRRHEPLIVALVPRGARMADCCIRSMSPEWVASGGNHGDHLSRWAEVFAQTRY